VAEKIFLAENDFFHQVVFPLEKIKFLKNKLNINENLNKKVAIWRDLFFSI